MLFCQEEAAAIASIAVFVSSEEGKEFYRHRYEVRLAQWAEETTATRAAQNARAEVFRDVQDKVTGWKNPEELVGYDELQDLFTLRMFVPKDPFKVAAALVEMTGVDAVLVEEALSALEEPATVPDSDNEVVTTRAMELLGTVQAGHSLVIQGEEGKDTTAMKLHCLSDEALARLDQTPEVLAEIHKRLARASQELVDASDDDATEFVSIKDAALELGWTEEQLIQQLIQDGLIIDLGDELVVSPHPDISRAG